jgi:RHS repeat-associated protein
LNRAVLMGEIASASSRTTWQNSLNASPAHHEDKTASGIGYTLANTLPNIAEANVLAVTYYDDYTFPKPANLGYVNTYVVNALSTAKNLQTGTRLRMLAGANVWLASATYYDAEYRAIQTVRELYDLGAGAIERVSMQYKYDLAPVIAQEKAEQIIATGTNVHLKTYEYDHADRLLSVKEKVVNGSKSREAVTIAQRYNALGQLQQKWFHSEDGINFRRRTTYTNNIRGWLAQGQTFYKTKENEPDSSFYNFSLSYANGNSYTNGNISQMQWSGKAENTFTKGMAFTYDGANRLLGSTGLNNYAETESGISYDKNGNIKTLIRSGEVLDNLSYAYVGNRLSAVTDASGSNLGVKNGVSTYAYDGNGNMTSDGNRGAVLSYNYLNLSKTVTIAGKTLTYDYDAAGAKHKYVADTLTAKYAGDFEYNQINVFKRLSISEGQAVYRKDSIRFDYYLKDHLGNVRVVFDERGRILQKTDYYPFGLEIDRNAPVQTPSARNNVNRLHYNGKELQVGTGYMDYGARMYMPEVGRWGVVDPLAEKGMRWSSYTYGLDNPIRFIDPDGMWPGQSLWNRLKESIKERSDWNKIPEHFKDYARKHPINALIAQKIALQGEGLEAKLGNSLGMNGETTDRTKSPHDGGVKNAVKHAFSSALVSMRIGKLDGNEITNLNEMAQKHDPLLSMDLANNQVGVGIGDGLSFTASNSEVLSKVLEAGLNGELTIVTFDKNNDPTANKVNLSEKKYESQVSKIREVIKTMRTQENDFKH